MPPLRSRMKDETVPREERWKHCPGYKLPHPAYLRSPETQYRRQNKQYLLKFARQKYGEILVPLPVTVKDKVTW